MTPKKISVEHLKSNFDEILRRVEVGESFSITKRGKPVADAMLSLSIDRSKAQVAINTIMAVKKHSVSDQELLAGLKAGRK